MDTDTGYLIADAAHPLITSGPVWQELLLYAIPAEREAELYACFESISGKALGPSDLLGRLSGGQKVILMACMAIFSPARRICFADLEHSLDSARFEAVLKMIEASGKAVRMDALP